MKSLKSKYILFFDKRIHTWIADYIYIVHMSYFFFMIECYLLRMHSWLKKISIIFHLSDMLNWTRDHFMLSWIKMNHFVIFQKGPIFLNDFIYWIIWKTGTYNCCIYTLSVGGRDCKNSLSKHYLLLEKKNIY